MITTNQHPINLRRRAWLCGALAAAGAVVAAAVFGSFRGALWVMTGPGLFAAMYPLSLLWRRQRDDLAGDPEAWRWRAAWREVRSQIVPALPVVLLLYVAQGAAAFWMGEWAWPRWGDVFSSRRAFYQLYTSLYANHVIFLPLFHLLANLALVLIWNRLTIHNRMPLLRPLLLMALVRMFFLSDIVPNTSIMILLGYSPWPGWSIEAYISDLVSVEDFWLFLKAVWAIVLLRVNWHRATQGASLAGLDDLAVMAVAALYRDEDSEDTGTVMRLLALRRRTFLIFWAAAAGLPVAHALIGNMNPKFVTQMSLVWLGLLWFVGIVLVGGRWLSFLGSPARRAVLLDLCLTPTPVPALLRGIVLAPVRQYLRLMGPLVLAAVVDVLIGAGELAARPLLLVGAMAAAIALHLILAPALMFNLLRHHSIAQAILRVGGLLFIVEGIVIGSLIIFGTWAGISEMMVLFVIALHGLWVVWALDYLLILRAEFITMAAAPPPREESLKPV